MSEYSENLPQGKGEARGEARGGSGGKQTSYFREMLALWCEGETTFSSASPNPGPAV